MMNNNNDNSVDDILDIGMRLKKEKLQNENHDKVEKLKASYFEDQKKNENNKVEKRKSSGKYNTLFFLAIIFFLAIGIRLYVSSMPITDDWAELVVEENLKRQVTNKIRLEYPTLSEAKIQELSVQGTLEAIN